MQVTHLPDCHRMVPYHWGGYPSASPFLLVTCIDNKSPNLMPLFVKIKKLKDYDRFFTNLTRTKGCNTYDLVSQYTITLEVLSVNFWAQLLVGYSVQLFLQQMRTAKINLSHLSIDERWFGKGKQTSQQSNIVRSKLKIKSKLLQII